MRSNYSRMMGANYPVIDLFEVSKWTPASPAFGTYVAWRVWFRGPLALARRRDDSGACYVDLPRSMSVCEVAKWLVANVEDWCGQRQAILVHIDTDGNEDYFTLLMP